MNVVTDVFYDCARRRWVVEYDERQDRRSHFVDRDRAFSHAVANGWEPGPDWVSGAGVYSGADVDDTL